MAPKTKTIEVPPGNQFYVAQSPDGKPARWIGLFGSEPFPDYADPNDAHSVHKDQARRIASALYWALPGGTWDQLLIEILMRHAGRFVVSYDKGEE